MLICILIKNNFIILSKSDYNFIEAICENVELQYEKESFFGKLKIYFVYEENGRNNNMVYNFNIVFESNDGTDFSKRNCKRLQINNFLNTNFKFVE